MASVGGQFEGWAHISAEATDDTKRGQATKFNMMVNGFDFRLRANMSETSDYRLPRGC